VIDARVYSGIHYRTSDEVGARLGRQVAQFVLTHALKLEAISQIAGIGLNALGAFWIGQHWSNYLWSYPSIGTTALQTHPDHFGRSMRTISDSSLDRSNSNSRPSGEISKSPIVKPRPSAVSCRSRPVLRSRTQSSL